MKHTFKIVFAFTLVYALVCSGMYAFQRSLLYKPSTQDPTEAMLPLINAQSLTLNTSDGEKLNAWWIAPQEGKPTFLYLHGNGGNLSDRAIRFQKMTSQGEGLLAIDWRGYGLSTGKPNEANLHADTKLAYDFLTKKVLPKDIVVFGESLGTAPAIKLASSYQIKALVLDSPFTSILEMAKQQYFWLPVETLLEDTFRSDVWVGEVAAPTLVLHGDADNIVPHSQGQKLFAMMNTTQKQFQTFPGGGHIVSYKLNGEQIVREFIEKTK